MPDPHRIQNELLTLLSRPQFASLLSHRNQFRTPGTILVTPESVASEAASYIWKNNLLLNPVEVLEMRGPIELYRAHDGGSRLHSAGTLGRCWFDRSVAKTIWESTARFAAPDRARMYMEFLRNANFVLPEWNDMRQIACMVVPAGCSVPVVRGRGDWKAIRTPPGISRAGGALGIQTAGDAIDHAGMMPIPGVVQYFVPLFNDMWVRPVHDPSARWPFLD